jgi:hypothetical protein
LKEESGVEYSVPLAKIDSDFELLKHALYTEPNYQCSWNYHKWLISLLLPVQLISLKKTDNEVELEFSSIIMSSSMLDIRFNEMKVPVIKSAKEASKTFTIPWGGPINAMMIKAQPHFQDINNQRLFRTIHNDEKYQSIPYP